MRYTPHTAGERAEVLGAIRVERFGQLFDDVPEAVRFLDLALTDGISELDLTRTFAALG